MKHLKQVLSLVLAVAMTLCLGIAATASGDSATTENTVTHTYELYQIFTGTVDDNSVLTNAKWGTNCISTYTAGNAVAEDILSALSNLSEEELLKNLENYVNLYSTPYQTSETTSFSNVAAGYYLIKDKDDSLNGAIDAAYTLYVVQVTKTGTLTFTPKSGVPTVVKKISENGALVDENNASIGDKVTYQITGTLPTNYADYSSYSYAFTDTLSAGLTYNNDVEVYLDKVDKGNLITTGYTGAYDAKSGVLTVTFDNLKTNTSIDKDSNIIVVYTATVNEKAVIQGDGNPNTVYLTYSNNPNSTGTGNTKPSTVRTYTWEFKIHKYAENVENLAGAEFQLTDSKGNDVKLSLLSGTTYYVDATNGSETVTSSADGKLVIQGLDSGTYTLSEKKAPDGYAKINTTVTIVIGTDGTVTVDDKVVDTVEVENKLITAKLPTTGGMGTTLFYIAGGVLVAAAAVLLIAKKQIKK